MKIDLHPYSKKPIHLLFTCGREPTYPRNALILSVFQEYFNVQTVTSSHSRLPIRYAKIFSNLLRHNRKRLDLIFAGFLGQPLIPLIRFFWKGPILFDAFLSIFDTLCFDRKFASPESVIGKLAFQMDQFSCSLADKVILDTQAHVDYFHETFHIPKEKMAVLFVGCDESIFSPQPIQSDPKTVLFYGSFLPLQGVEVIVKAAGLLKETPIQFRIIGDGIEKKRIANLVQELKVKNIKFFAPVPLEQLPCEISAAEICLGGHFGTSDKAKRVIAGKTFQCIAMGKPTIVGDNSANRELLTHGKDAWFCEMGSPQALAQAIQTLIADRELRDRLGRNGRDTYLKYASKQALSQKIVGFVEEMIANQ